MEVLKKNTKSIAITAGVTALTVAGLYLIYKRYKTGGNKNKVTNPENSPALSEKQKDAIIKSVKVTYDGQVLSIDTVLDMAAASSKFCVAACIDLRNENTRARRANKDDLIKYARLCQEFNTGTSLATAQARKEVSDRLGVPEDLWERSFQHYLEQGNPKLADIQFRIAQAENEISPQTPLRELSKEEVIKMMAMMTEAYKVELVNVPLLNAEFRDPNLTTAVIGNRATDAVYEEFSYSAKEFKLAMQKYLPQLGVEDQKVYQDFMNMSMTVRTAPHQAI